MKKFLLSLIFSLLICNNGFAFEFKTPKDIQIYMRTQFVYANDRVFGEYFEYNQLPFILDFTRLGDCDDFALYSYYNLQKLNIESTMYVLYLKSNEQVLGHAITVFKNNYDTYSVFTNNIILPTNQTDPIEAIKDVYPTWLFIGEWHPKKFGYLTHAEFIDAVQAKVFRNLESIINYFRWESFDK